MNEIGEALGELAQATSDPNRAKSVLAELAAVAYETRSWVLSVAPEAPTVRNELEGIAERLTVYEQWAQAGLLDLALLQGFLRGETPPLLPTLLPQVPTAVPTPPAAVATAGPTVTETPAIVVPTIASLATRSASPTQAVDGATAMPTALSTGLPGVSVTPAQSTLVTLTPTGNLQQSPVATKTPRPVTPTPPNTPTATPRPNTPTPTDELTETEEPTETPDPIETSRPTDEPTETEEPTETSEQIETSRPTRTPESSNTPKSTTTDEPTEMPESRQQADYPPWVSGKPTAWPVSTDSSAARTTARSHRPSRAVIFGVLP